MHAPEGTDYIKREAYKLDATNDNVDEVNKLKGSDAYDEGSTFDARKDKDGFRRYEETCDRVKNFYAEQHQKQTIEDNLRIRTELANTFRAKMSIWEETEMLNTLVDESDPTNPSVRSNISSKPPRSSDGMGNQIGCKSPDLSMISGKSSDSLARMYSETIIYLETFKTNADFHDEKLMTECGIYEPGCGLDNVLISHGHDEYSYGIFKKQSRLPKEGLAMIRYHSFYPWHLEGVYRHLMNEEDESSLRAAKTFNLYDLYSKSDDPPKVDELKPYYLDWIKSFFPDEIEW